MDDESVDAEVIAPNSPLYQYLSEAGYSPAELDTYEDKPQETTNAINNDLPMHVRFVAAALALGHSVQQWACHAWSTFLSSIYGIDSKQLLSAILESPLLLEDDHRFLESLLSAQNHVDTSQKDGYPILAITGAVFVLTSARWFVAAAWGVLDYVLATTVCLSISWLLLARLKKDLILQQERSLRALLALQKDFRSNVKKCLQVIQESEIVARGFTLASHNVPVQRLEMNKLVPSLDPHRQCPELRQCLFHWTREMFLYCRSMTSDLMKSVPLAGELDSCLLYLACTDPEELSKELFSNDEEELYVGTDFYSLSALKSMLYLLDVQQSEFLRRLALSIAPNIKKTRQHWTYELNRVVNRSKKTTRDYFNKVTNAYQLYKSYSAVRTMASTESSSLVSLPVQDLLIAVHSLALHLQAAIKRVEAMEDISASADKEQLDEAVKSRMKCLLTEVQAEITSAGTCVQDVTNCIESGEKCKDEPAEGHLHRGLLSMPSGDVQQVLTIDEGSDPVIVDEVFEALLTEKPDPLPDDDDDDFIMVPKEARAKQKEASAVVLKELRSVLVGKAREHQEREKMALARSGVEGELFDQLGFVVPEVEHKDDQLTTASDEPLELVANGSLDDAERAGESGPGPVAANEPICETKEATFSSENTVEEGSELASENDDAEANEERRVLLPPERFLLPHPTNVAQMAVDRARLFSPLQVCTFEDTIGGSSSEDDENRGDD